MELQGLLIVCPLVFLAGFVDAIAGGGGIISLPAYLFAGIPPHMALGTNKLSSTSGTLISTIRYMKNGYLKGIGLLAALAAVAAIAGSAAGSRIALFVPGKIIENLMLIVLPVVAFFVLRNKSFSEEKEAQPLPGKKRIVSGSVDYRLGIAGAVCCIAGHYVGAGMVVKDGTKIVKPVVIFVLAALFIKVILGK